MSQVIGSLQSIKLLSSTPSQGRSRTQKLKGRRGRVGMVVGFTTTYAISAYHH